MKWDFMCLINLCLKIHNTVLGLWYKYLEPLLFQFVHFENILISKQFVPSTTGQKQKILIHVQIAIHNFIHKQQSNAEN